MAEESSISDSNINSHTFRRVRVTRTRNRAARCEDNATSSNQISSSTKFPCVCKCAAKLSRKKNCKGIRKNRSSGSKKGGKCQKKKKKKKKCGCPKKRRRRSSKPKPRCRCNDKPKKKRKCSRSTSVAPSKSPTPS